MQKDYHFYDYYVWDSLLYLKNNNYSLIYFEFFTIKAFVIELIINEIKKRMKFNSSVFFILKLQTLLQKLLSTSLMWFCLFCISETYNL